MRDPRMRLRDIGEARIALQGAGADPEGLSAPEPTAALPSNCSGV